MEAVTDIIFLGSKITTGADCSHEIKRYFLLGRKPMTNLESESEVAQSCPTLCNLWTIAHQAPPSMGFSRQEYRSGLSFPSPEVLPDPGIEPRSPALQADALTSAPPGKPLKTRIQVLTSKISREEREPGGRKKGEEGERGGLTDVSCQLQIPRCYGTFPWASREGRTGTRPCQKSDQTRIRIRVLCQEEVISLQFSVQAEGPLTRVLCPGLGD